MKKLKELISTNQNRVIITLLVIIILLGIIARIYVGSKKEYLQIDEGYSYGLMNYKKIDLTKNDDLYDNWHKKEYYKDYLSISREESLNFTPVYENQKNDVHPPFYYLLLRIAANFTIDSFSMWTGIILNIIIFVISSIFIYLIANRIFKNNVYALLIVLINSFSYAALETTIFIRMYALNALNLLMISYLHICSLNKENLTLKELIPMSILIVIGSLTHYYYLVFLFILYVMYMAFNLVKKNYKNAIKYTVMMVISAMVSLAIFPYSFVHIFMGYRGAGAVSKLENIEQIWNSLGRYIEILNDNTFNGILIFLAIISFIIIVYKIVNNRKLVIEFKNKNFWFMFIPAVFYFILVALVSPYKEIRYIMPVCPFMIIGVFYLLKVLLEKVVSARRTFMVLSLIFITMLIYPKLADIEISYLYKGYGSTVQRIEEHHNIPMLYILNLKDNRFLDDVYLYSKVDNSYILDSDMFEDKKIKEIFENINTADGIYVMISEHMDYKTYLDTIKQTLNFSSYEHVARMNACDIYEMKQ